MNERNKKRLVGAFVVMTAFAMVVVMAMEAMGCLFPTLEVEQADDGGTGSKANQRLLLSALTEEEMEEYRMLPEEKRLIVNRWMDVGLNRELLTDEMLEKMAKRIVMYLSKSSECVPICFREDAFVMSKVKLTDYITKYAEMQSKAFPDTTLIATKDSGDRCYFSTLGDFAKDTAFGFANRENEGPPHVRFMKDATNELRDLGDGNDLGAESRMLIIGHGIGYLPYVLQKAFPEVYIDSVDIDPAIFEIANQWFCYHKMMDGNLKIEKFVADGTKYFEKLKTGEKKEKYDVIHLDVFDSNGILSYFEDKKFFRSVDELWKLWNDVEDRPRMLVINGYHDDQRVITETIVYKNAVEIFGADRVKKHAHTVFSVASRDRKCVDE